MAGNLGIGEGFSLADGKLVGDGFEVEHILKGESIQDVLTHAHNKVRQPSHSIHTREAIKTSMNNQKIRACS